MLVIILFLLCVGGVIWVFVSEDIRTKRHLQFLADLDKLNSKEK